MHNPLWCTFMHCILDCGVHQCSQQGIRRVSGLTDQRIYSSHRQKETYIVNMDPSSMCALTQEDQAINWISNLDFPAFCGQFCPRRGFRGWISGTAVPKPSILSAAATRRTPSHFHTVKSDALHGVRCFQQEHCAAAVPSTRLCSLTAKLSNKCTPVVNWKLLGVISYMALSRSTMYKNRSISVQFLVQCIILIIQWIIHIIVYNSAQCIMQLHEVRPLRINLASDYIANSLRQELIVLENCFERKWEKI